jgi:hypothetical protein
MNTDNYPDYEGILEDWKINRPFFPAMHGWKKMMWFLRCDKCRNIAEVSCFPIPKQQGLGLPLRPVFLPRHNAQLQGGLVP